MLVLSRRAHENIIATLEDGRKITITLVEVRGDKVRIGIDAPKTIAVHRGEVQGRLDGKEALALPMLKIGDPLPGAKR